MNERMLRVRQKRGELTARIAFQRGEIASLGEKLKGPLLLADQGIAGLKFLRARPVLVGMVAALLVLRRNGLVVLFRRSLMVWRGYRYLKDASRKFSGLMGR